MAETAMAGRLSIRKQTRWWPWVVAAGLGVLALPAAVLTWFALGPASLHVVGTDMHADPATRTFTEDYAIRNDGGSAEDLVAADISAPGITVVSTNVGSSLHIGTGKTVHLVMRFRVTNCEAAPFGPVPVHLRLDRWWGIRTVTVADHGVDYPDARDACIRSRRCRQTRAGAQGRAPPRR